MNVITETVTRGQPPTATPSVIDTLTVLVARLEVVVERLTRVEDSLDRQRRPYGTGHRGDSFRRRRA